MEEVKVSVIREGMQKSAEIKNKMLKLPLSVLAKLFTEAFGKLSLMYQEICILTDSGCRAPQSAPQKVNMRLTFTAESMISVWRRKLTQEEKDVLQETNKDCPSL